MNPEKVSGKASKIAREAKALLEVVSEFGPKFEKRILKAVRRSVLEEVERAFQKTMLKVEEMERLFGSPLHEYWLFTIHTKYKTDYSLDPIRILKEKAQDHALRGFTDRGGQDDIPDPL